MGDAFSVPLILSWCKTIKIRWSLLVTMKRLLQKCCFGNPNMVTQIEVDLELHTLTQSRLTPDWTIQKK